MIAKDEQAGLSVRFVQQYDIKADQMPSWVDVYAMELPVRARWKRTMRWPAILWAYRKSGASWRTAWRLTHWVIWYEAR